MLRRVVSLEYTDVSELRTASIIRVIIALMLEAVHASETSVYSEITRRYIREGSNIHKIVFILSLSLLKPRHIIRLNSTIMEL
jgi:hypothetical protein